MKVSFSVNNSIQFNFPLLLHFIGSHSTIFVNESQLWHSFWQLRVAVAAVAAPLDVATIRGDNTVNNYEYEFLKATAAARLSSLWQKRE